MLEDGLEYIDAVIERRIGEFASNFQARHDSELDNVDGVINSKRNNPFIRELGEEVTYYAALSRSLDSSLGTMLEELGLDLATHNFDVYRGVNGGFAPAQRDFIAELLESYARGDRKPAEDDYQVLRQLKPAGDEFRRHVSDYYLIDLTTGVHYLIELKIGGDLDNKKARSEKEALLEQFSILSNTLDDGADIKLRFATAYNKNGDGNPWSQGRVAQFFAQSELLIGRDFWNFICKSQAGYDTVMMSYRKHAPVLREALEQVKTRYLGGH